MTLTLKIIIGMALGFLSGLLINTFSLSSNYFVDTYFVNGLFDTVGSIFISSLINLSNSSSIFLIECFKLTLFFFPKSSL